MQCCFGRPAAMAHICGGDEAPCISGDVQFYQKHGVVLVEASISGLPQNSDSEFFALHIHEGESCSGESFSDTGGHYNPDGGLHPKHVGDLPPLLSCKGTAYLVVQTDRFCVKDIIGRTVVIHSGADDFRSQPAGSAGNKIACGVICRM